VRENIVDLTIDTVPLHTLVPALVHVIVETVIVDVDPHLLSFTDTEVDSDLTTTVVVEVEVEDTEVTPQITTIRVWEDQ
jgi:hypothetical protein